MKITLLRHAEVQEEYLGKYNGHNDISLSQNGRLQAKKLSVEFKAKNFDKIYCSDLRRTKETLELLELPQQVVYSEKLREKSWGIHEGKSFDEIQEMGVKYENFEQYIDALDGENMQEYILKIESYFKEVIFKQDAENILVVTHSGVIKVLLSILNKTSLEEAFGISLPYASFKILNIT